MKISLYKEGYFLEVDVQYLEKLREFYNDLLFLPERMKIEKVEKLLPNLHDQTEYVIHIRNLKQAWNHGLVLKKVHTMIKFNESAWLKPYIDINTDLRKKQEMILKNNFLSWWVIQCLEKLWKMRENIKILNLPQQKEEGTIWYQNQIIIIQSFSQNIY